MTLDADTALYFINFIFDTYFSLAITCGVVYLVFLIFRRITKI